MAIAYDGFQIRCGCTCSRCNHPLILEGYSDPAGNHYCRYCDDYVPANEKTCKARTQEKIDARLAKITAAGAN